MQALIRLIPIFFASQNPSSYELSRKLHMLLEKVFTAQAQNMTQLQVYCSAKYLNIDSALGDY